MFNYCYKAPLLFPLQNKKVRSVNFPKSTFKHINQMRRGLGKFPQNVQVNFQKRDRNRMSGIF